MWTLVFVFANSVSNVAAPSTIIIPAFKSKEACMSAQQSLIDQAKVRQHVIRMNLCVKGD